MRESEMWCGVQPGTSPGLGTPVCACSCVVVHCAQHSRAQSTAWASIVDTSVQYAHYFRGFEIGSVCLPVKRRSARLRSGCFKRIGFKQTLRARTGGRTDGSFGVGGRRRTDAATFSASRCAPGRGATKRTSVAGVGPVRRRRHVRAALVNREGISRRCINWAGFAQRGRACILPRVRIREGVHGWALLREFDFASSARSLYELFGSIW